ncbi:hypothetical protein ACFPTR_01050 [Aliibacillus thermotolerans]|uniref:Uncharacterized protein n=1 Tax=Aliibacillus thermotolerans TaxID=1834418 RepID=A0ABW0U452_9BACI|nr:hypothetical protein [Aliibacillus thermotolerans]MDA3128808.1 hypothetical protein [Aliibacillus thermotolerans]
MEVSHEWLITLLQSKMFDESKPWIAHAAVSFKNSLWKQALNGSWHPFNPNTIVKAIQARFQR